MTPDETNALRALVREELAAIGHRVEHIEHITAGIAGQTRRDQDENRQLWRDTQNQLARLAQDVDRFVLEAATRDQATNLRFTELDQLARERDDRLRERIEALVSAVGALAQRTR